MKHLFLNKELSQLAKDKGFDEPCLAYYTYTDEFILLSAKIGGELAGHGSVKNELFRWLENNKKTNGELYILSRSIAAPLYQQILDWFRDIKNLFIKINMDDGEEVTQKFYNYILFETEWGTDKEMRYINRKYGFTSYYEALDKAIEEAFKLI